MRLHSYIDKRGWRKCEFEYVSIETHNYQFPLHYNLSTKVSGLFVDLKNNPYKVKKLIHPQNYKIVFRTKHHNFWGPAEPTDEVKNLYKELIK
jgi:hypothetical protein